MAEVAFQGEVQFRRYSDTSTQGQQVVFAVEDREALEPFIGKEGKRFMAVLVEIGDDEQPVKPQPKEREYLGDLCWRAIQWCKEPEFQRWIVEVSDLDAEPSEELTSHVIKEWCGVASRRELDSEPGRSKFLAHIVGPWRKHCIARGIA